MARYAFQTMEDRLTIQKLWEAGRTAKEISDAMEKSVDVVYKELSRGRDGSRLPDQRLRYSAKLAQLRVQQSLERRGKRAGQVTDSSQTANPTAANR